MYILNSVVHDILHKNPGPCNVFFPDFEHGSPVLYGLDLHRAYSGIGGYIQCDYCYCQLMAYHFDLFYV